MKTPDPQSGNKHTAQIISERKEAAREAAEKALELRKARTHARILEVCDVASVLQAELRHSHKEAASLVELLPAAALVCNGLHQSDDAAKLLSDAGLKVWLRYG